MVRYTTTLWALLALAIFLCFWGNDKTPLFDTDEPRYAQAAKEMMLRGDWVLPTFNGQPRYAKPVMFYWLLIAAYKIFGVNEFAARFWSGVAAMVITLLLYFALRTIFGQESALAASLCWLTSIAALIFAHAAITDMVLVAFMTRCNHCSLGWLSDKLHILVPSRLCLNRVCSAHERTGRGSLAFNGLCRVRL
jgi:4-amino-4-deoxy-L-arabinose transferase-like glycosyltransferase